MRLFSAAQVAAALPYSTLVEGLRETFRDGATVPLRTMLVIDGAPGPAATLALMPAWQAGRTIAVKLATIFPDNSAKGLPTIHAQVVVFDGVDGAPVAILDGTEITRRRTAAASALAATYLAREDAARLLVVGTGAQAPHSALAHASVRPIERIDIWGRRRERALAVAETVRAERPGLEIEVVEDLDAAVRRADIVSCATSATEPIVRGVDLPAGVMLDLAGSHTAGARECDTEAVRRSRVYVDTLSGAMAEAGELLTAIRDGVVTEQHVLGDLYGLCRGVVAGRRDAHEITLFKSVGTGLEDLAAACLVLKRFPDGP